MYYVVRSGTLPWIFTDIEYKKIYYNWIHPKYRKEFTDIKLAIKWLLDYCDYNCRSKYEPEWLLIQTKSVKRWFTYYELLEIYNSWRHKELL